MIDTIGIKTAASNTALTPVINHSITGIRSSPFFKLTETYLCNDGRGRKYNPIHFFLLNLSKSNTNNRIGLILNELSLEDTGLLDELVITIKGCLLLVVIMFNC